MQYRTRRVGLARQTSRMARIHDVVFDCHRPAPLARFWAAVLDGYDIAPYDDAEIERLRSIGIDDISTGAADLASMATAFGDLLRGG